jgi:hypothetical protein
MQPPPSLVIRALDPSSSTTLIKAALGGAGDALGSSTEYVCVGDIISTGDEVRRARDMDGPCSRFQPLHHLLSLAPPALMQDSYLRGHGTQLVDGKLVATLCGVSSTERLLGSWPRDMSGEGTKA